MDQDSYVASSTNNTLTIAVVVFSIFALVFFVNKRLQEKCNVEPIMAVTSLALFYGIQYFTQGDIVWVNTINGFVPLGRYYSWMITLPPILAQILSLYGLVGYTQHSEILFFLFILLQVYAVATSFASVSVGTQKYLFFVLSIASVGAFLIQFYLLYREQKKLFPEDIKLPLYILTMSKVLAIFLYPVVWIIGPAGMKYMAPDTDVSLTAILDTFSKICIPILAWYIRWNYLANENVTNTGRILTTRRAGSNAKNKFGLSEEELQNAQDTPFHVLLLDSDILVQKTILLMMQMMDVNVSIAFDTVHAIEHLENNPSYLFDCVLVVPRHHKTRFKRQALADLSKMIVKDPYKIPLLGLDFTQDKSIQDPGEYIHGLIQRPLDQYSFCEELYAWRITASMWRRVALTMENIENDPNFFPKLEDLPEEAQQTMAASSMQLRRRGSLFGQTLFQAQEDQGGVLQQPPNVPQPALPVQPVVQSEAADVQRWNYVVSNFKR